MSSDYEVCLMTEADIPGAIDTIQQAFADDPYNKWIYNDRSKVSTLVPLPLPLPLQLLKPSHSFDPYPNIEQSSTSLAIDTHLPCAVAGVYLMGSSMSAAPAQHPKSSAPQCGCHQRPPPSLRAGVSGSPAGGYGSHRCV
jgi:hypothetical protein